MRWSDPNRPESGATAKGADARDAGFPNPRDLDTNGTGDPMQDGYTLIARRPRVKSFTDTVSPEKADRIEQIFRPFLDDEPQPDD
jgi:hypothetical protein